MKRLALNGQPTTVVAVILAILLTITGLYAVIAGRFGLAVTVAIIAALVAWSSPNTLWKRPYRNVTLRGAFIAKTVDVTLYEQSHWVSIVIYLLFAATTAFRSSIIALILVAVMLIDFYFDKKRNIARTKFLAEQQANLEAEEAEYRNTRYGGDYEIDHTDKSDDPN